jgi:GT2 family glycosyltransferase
LRLAAAQSRPPSQIIVVDASADWCDTRRQVERDLESIYPNIEWIFEPAHVKSAASQRNQGIRLASEDVLFLLDDDSLMFPPAAAYIMSVYEEDVERKMAGVSLCGSREAPDAPKRSSRAAQVKAVEQPKTDQTRVGLVRRLKKAAVPEWPGYLKNETPGVIPDSLKHHDLLAVRQFSGCYMTFRREICEKEPFTDWLKGYSVAEDYDISNRARRHGIIAKHRSALCHHAKTVGGRPANYQLEYSRALNHWLLHTLYAACRRVAFARMTKWSAHSLFYAALVDIKNRKATLPAVRGLLSGVWSGVIAFVAYNRSA